MPVVIALIILLTLAGGYYLFSDQSSESPPTEGSISERSVQQQNIDSQSDSANTAADEIKANEQTDLAFEEKTETYKKIEKARRDLDRRLARIKMSLWNVEMPKEEANALTEQLMSAHRLLRKPKLMGAFHGQNEMQHELSSLEYAIDNVEKLRLQIEASKAAGQ